MRTWERQAAISIAGNSWRVGRYLFWERVYDARFSHSGNESKQGKPKLVILVKVERKCQNKSDLYFHLLLQRTS